MARKSSGNSFSKQHRNSSVASRRRRAVRQGAGWSQAWIRATRLESLEDRRMMAGNPTDGDSGSDGFVIPDWVSPAVYFTAYGGAFSRSQSDRLSLLKESGVLSEIQNGTSSSSPTRLVVDAKVRVNENEPFVPVGNETQFVNNLPSTPQVVNLGFGEGQVDAIDIRGSLSEPARIIEGSFLEPDGTIFDANITGLDAGELIGISADIGDPNGLYDVDFYEIRNVAQGQTITANVRVTDIQSALDPVVIIYNSFGEIVAFNDDYNGAIGLDSYVSYIAEEADDYYVAVVDSAVPLNLPVDPFRTSTGLAPNGTVGNYRLEIGLNGTDQDYYALDLNAGDILGVDIRGAARTLELFHPDGRTLLIGSSQDLAQFVQPAASPLPFGGAAATSAVIPTTGRYFVRANGPDYGRYQLAMRLFRPVLERAEKGAKQILFLDFNGQTINGEVFGADPTPLRTLSPMSDFLTRWGIGGEGNALIDEIVKVVRESLYSDLKASGVNPNFDIEIRNSRDHKDPYGLPNVSRIIIGGTIDELGIPTIGIAQSVDIGNFETEETAVVLLDLLSEDETDPNSLNQFPVAGNLLRRKVELVARGVGNIAAHEAGHFFGAWHTDQFNDVPNLMDQGGNLVNTIGVGPDRVFGTQDDVDVDFVTDEYVSNEGFVGFEDTLSQLAWGLTTGKGLQSGVTSSGSVWNDANGDGVRGTSERGLGDVLIYVDSNRDGRFGIGEPAARTLADGNYSIPGLAAGSYVLRAITPTGMVQTFPTGDGSHSVTVTTGGPSITGRNFGFRPGQAVNEGFDSGDAPAPYPAASAGVQPNFRMGATVDGDGALTLNSAATGDDNNGADDEDGVTVQGLIVPTLTATINVSVNHGGNPRGVIQAWIDFDADGVWEADEQIAKDQVVSDGVNTVTFAVPRNATPGTTIARFRLGYERGIGPSGRAQVGEVEDHAVVIQPPPVTAPTANNDQFEVNAGSTGNSLNVLANDTANVAGSLEVFSVTVPSQGGTITVNSTKDRILYTPAAGFTGLDTFSYTVRNSLGGIATASVAVTVNPFIDPNPNAVDDQFNVTENTTGNVLGVLTNDITPSGETITITSFGTPSEGGTLAIVNNGLALSYAPATDFVGTETFTYTVRTGAGNTDTATVTITVSPEQTSDALAQFRLQALNAQGQPVQSVAVGQQFTLVGFVDDLRANPLGVFSAYFDVEFPIANFTVDSGFVYGAGFDSARAGTVVTTGAEAGFDNVGALGGLSQTNKEVHQLFSIQLTPTQAGAYTFTSELADDNTAQGIRDLLLFGVGDELTPDQVDFPALTLTVTPTALNLTNPANPLDVNNDGFVSPIDGLLVINVLNRSNGQTAAAAGLAGEGGDAGFYLDVNGDGFVSPIDALLVINKLNQLAATPAPPAAESTTSSSAATDAVFADDSVESDSINPLLAAIASEGVTKKKSV